MRLQRTTAIGATLVLASCASSAGVLGAVPTLGQLRVAVDQNDFDDTFANVNCKGRTECYNARPRTMVRNPRCAATGEQTAHCDYEFRTTASKEWEPRSADFGVGFLLNGKPGWQVAKPQ